jgi:hypothetical protein
MGESGENAYSIKGEVKKHFSPSPEAPIIVVAIPALLAMTLRLGPGAAFCSIAAISRLGSEDAERS